MNFGEKLKQIRTDKNMTQPQLAEAIGIEQSYLSKLENDKSVPSAEMFQSIIKALGMDARDFLKDIDRKVLNGALKQIPEVANFINVGVVTRVHNARMWLIGSAAACCFGFALMLAANDGIVFPNNQYKYESQCVILNNESEDIFKQYRTIQEMRRDAKIITPEEFLKSLSDFEASRVRLATIETWENKGTVYFQPVDNGRRKFELVNTRNIRSTGNKFLQYLGALFLFGGVAGFFIEWRLRRLQAQLARQ